MLRSTLLDGDDNDDKDGDLQKKAFCLFTLSFCRLKNLEEKQSALKK